MRIGVFQAAPPRVKAALQRHDWMTAKLVTDYQFAAPGRAISVAGVVFGKIMSVKVVDYRNPRRGNAVERRFYSVVQVYPAQETMVQTLMERMQVAPDGILDFNALRA